MSVSEVAIKEGLLDYDNCYQGDVRIVNESEWTCPFWIRGPVFQMNTIVFGCGGYGEVSHNHPAASSQILDDPDGPYMCGRCHGTGLFSKRRAV